MRKRDFARHVARESAIGCVTHFLLAMAGVIFLGGAAAYHGRLGKVLFIVAALMLFAGAVQFPGSKRGGMGKNDPRK
jgi:hypothetical protein